MALSSALAQEGVSRVSSYISTKLDDRASRAHSIERLEMALSRLEFVLERTRKMPMTHVSLLQRRNKLESAYIEGRDLLNKHKPRVLESHEEVGQVAVVEKSSSYLYQRIARAAANMSISSLLGLNKEHLSSSDAQRFEWYADCADKFVTDVESGCPLRRHIFRYPFVTQLFQGKILSSPSASDEAADRNVMTDDRTPLKLTVSFEPHSSVNLDARAVEYMGSKTEQRPFGDTQQTVDMVRSRSADCLIREQREVTEYMVSWLSKHGSAYFVVEKLITNTATVPKAYHTRSAAKRKRRNHGGR
ncbi:hypothetical protein C2845_PM13G02850 [Panicum miliaceum]|uniref:Uncharacterized protein n=1 Tax=Panicum miliaceum TaxID=4540 RepID=A0A3L6RHZ5_PANMI|nr:hypothetical protein C2845_PM13G02850 [Panicum miliaceum]